jgi:hypothetical protein
VASLPPAAVSVTGVVLHVVEPPSTDVGGSGASRSTSHLTVMVRRDELPLTVSTNL